MTLRQHHRGNALFLILIAVALFAALSYAISQSGRGSGSAAKEQAMLTASQAMQDGARIASAVQRLTLSGCSETDLSFAYDSNNDGAITAADAYYNAATPSGKSCMVLDPAGGGIEPSIMARINAVSGAGQAAGHSTTSADLMLYIAVSLETCQAINYKVFNDTTTMPTDSTVATSSYKFTGSYGGSSHILGDGSAATGISGKYIVCFINAGSPTGYLMSQLLLAR